MNKQKTAFRAVPWIIGVLSIAGMVWFAGPVHWNVLNIGNIFGFLVCAILFLFAVLFRKIQNVCKKRKGFRRFVVAACAVFSVGVVWATALSGCMIAGMQGTPPKTATVVVLGSKVSGTVPSADLRARIDAAGDYLKANPQAVCIASGGQGPGERVTEAAAIREGLTNRGIDGSRILLEDRSTTTKENIAYSLEIIQKNGLSRQLAVVTDEYHQFRAARVVRSVGADPYPVPARTPWYIFSACWARELMALTYALFF